MDSIPDVSMHSLQQSLDQIMNLETKFNFLRLQFNLPAVLDFVTPSASNHNSLLLISIATSNSTQISASPLTSPFPSSHFPALAFSSSNAPVHLYLEQLARINLSLDNISSYSNSEVRQRRKTLIDLINTETWEIDVDDSVEGRGWRGVWRRANSTGNGDLAWNMPSVPGKSSTLLFEFLLSNLFIALPPYTAPAFSQDGKLISIPLLSSSHTLAQISLGSDIA
jgi:hypothetical protein